MARLGKVVVVVVAELGVGGVAAGTWQVFGFWLLRTGLAGFGESTVNRVCMHPFTRKRKMFLFCCFLSSGEW